MTFLRNAWYCAGFSRQLGAGTLRPITMLSEPLVLFRDAEGRVTALQDRCPHRFAPLSQGTLVDGALQCPYHGLRFDHGGHCVLNPHGDGKIPQAARVRRYPALERHDALWVWMGEPERADPALLPDFSMIEERPGWTRVDDQLTVRANYQLVIDNLLDLTHVNYLHPFLGNGEAPPPDYKLHQELLQDDRSVTAISEMHHCPMNMLYRMLWERGEAPRYCDMRANMRWHPPSLLYLDTGATYIDRPKAEGPTMETVHWLTPETPRSTHYFWVATRDRHVGIDAVSEQVRAGIDGAFRGEDEPMIEAVQERMQTDDLWSLKPVLLTTDGPAVRARRLLASLIEAEKA